MNAVSSNDFEKTLACLLDCYHQGGHLVVLTGAGISQESGIPTFRDAQTGLWEKFSPEDLATRDGFLANPELVWNWYDHRRNGVWNAQPNAGHSALASLEQRFSQFTLITQNVDQLHQRAGSQRVIELHGNIFRYKCLDKNHPVNLERLGTPEEVPPRCPMCNSWLRPDVVWFGESLPERLLAQAFEAAGTAQVMLVVGTSGAVQPAASLPLVAKEVGATVIEVNTERNVLTAWMVDYMLQGRAGEQLSRLVEALAQKLDGHGAFADVEKGQMDDA